MAHTDPPASDLLADARLPQKWLDHASHPGAAEDLVQKRMQRACARLALGHIRRSFLRLERETRAHGSRADAAAMAGLAACVGLPLLLIGAAIAASFAGVAYPFGLSPIVARILCLLITLLPALFIGFYRVLFTYLESRHRGLRDDETLYLSFAAEIASSRPGGRSSSELK